MSRGRDAAPPGEDGADDESTSKGWQAEHHDSADDVTADAYAARALRTIGREIGMVPIIAAIGELIDEWSAGAA